MKNKFNFIKSDTELIVDYGLSFIEQVFYEATDFSPFAAKISISGDLIPIGYKTPTVTGSKIIKEITEFLNLELKQKKIRSFGIFYDALIQRGESINKSNVIVIAIIHSQDLSFPEIYFPYEITESGLKYGESFCL